MNTNHNKSGLFELKPYTKGEFIILYKISDYIFTNWMKALQPELGRRIGNFYNVNQVQLIVNRYGVPGRSIELDAEPISLKDLNNK